MMSVHKFGQKPIHWYKSRRQPRTIYWIPKMGVKHPPRKIQPETWEIFNQNRLVIRPKENKTIGLTFGFMMSRGMVLTTLKQALKKKQCSIQNEVILENADDIIINVINNSNMTVVIEENEPLCLIHYLI